MGFGETKSSTSYGRPPWIFKGSALYQLHLVKAETARAFIPKEFRLVEAFGNCVESPNVLWAARVLVNSEEACHHGRKDVGLPSQVARFSKRITPVPRQTKSNFGGFLNMIGVGTTVRHSKDCMDVQVTEVVGPASSDICNIKLITDVPTPKFNKWMGPLITMSLPSFSGQTEYNPNLLKYSCRIACRVRAVRPAKVSGPSPLKDRNSASKTTDFTAEEVVDNRKKLSISVMLSKPILALEFNFLEMQVEAPTILPNNSTSSLRAA